MNSNFPLQWPVDWPRTQRWEQKIGPNKMPSSRIRQLLAYELKKLGANDIVLSTNMQVRRDGIPYAGQREPSDPGVVLYFKKDGQNIALPCDRWRTVDANLRAIGMTVEAMRGIERWGTKQMVDRAFTGYAQLPEHASETKGVRSWNEVLQVSAEADDDIVKAAYRKLAAKYHPDNAETGDIKKFLEVQHAFNEATS